MDSSQNKSSSDLRGIPGYEQVCQTVIPRLYGYHHHRDIVNLCQNILTSQNKCLLFLQKMSESSEPNDPDPIHIIGQVLRMSENMLPPVAQDSLRSICVGLIEGKLEIDGEGLIVSKQTKQ